MKVRIKHYNVIRWYKIFYAWPVVEIDEKSSLFGGFNMI